MSDPTNEAPDAQNAHTQRVEKDSAYPLPDAAASAQATFGPHVASPIWAPPTASGLHEATTPPIPRGEPVASPATLTTASGQVRGPLGYPILIGLLALVVATAAAIHHTGYVVLDWKAIGAPALLVVGVLFVVLGGIGLIRRR